MLADCERDLGAPATSTIDDASKSLAHDLRADDTAVAYRSTIATQRAIFVASVATARALVAAGAMPGAVAGHSVGAFAAAVVADALPFDDALQLVDLRARAMHAAFPVAFGMGVVNGLTETDVATIVAGLSTATDPLYVANVNGDVQIVIAGTLTSVARALEFAIAEGARCTRILDVPVPSHTPLMDDVAKRLAFACKSVTIRKPRIPIATNIDGRLTREPDRLRYDLAASVARPVRWADATRALYERGVRCFIEMRPGHVLADLATIAFEDARSASVENVGLASAVALVARSIEK